MQGQSREEREERRIKSKGPGSSHDIVHVLDSIFDTYMEKRRVEDARNRAEYGERGE